MSGDTHPLDEVVRAAAEGSRSDVARIMDAMRSRTPLMVAARLSPSPAHFDAVDEITQQVLIALIDGLKRLENRTLLGLKAFASGIVVRKVSDYLKRRGKATGGPKMASLDATVAASSEAGPLWEFLSASGTSPRTAAERAEQVTRLLAELGTLETQQREVITLAFFDELPMNEIARRLGTSRPAASMRLIRAVQTLRRNMTGASRIEQGDGTGA